MCKFKLNIDEWSRAKGPEIYLAKCKNLIVSVLEPESNERLFDKCCLTSGGFPGGASGEESTSQWKKHRRRGFHPSVGKIPWRRAQQPTPRFLPGKSHGQRSLAGYSSLGCKESDPTEVT